MFALFVIAAQAAQTAPPKPVFIMPPKAAEVTGAIEQVTLAPIFRGSHSCSEHFYGQIPYAGDALGTDCHVTDGLQGDSGFSRAYRTDGKTNEDWYSWKAEVLSPTDGAIAGVVPNNQVNVPGTLGKPPAGMIQIRRDDGILVTLGHVMDARVKAGERVAAGQVIALVGNNGFSRAPHIHVGAYRLATAEPLQIRWDLRAMARLQSGGEEKAR